MTDLTDSPRFPPELEREIFEMFALDNLDTEARKILIVAKRVHEWIEPLIYRVMLYYPMPKTTAPPQTRVLHDFCFTHQVTPRLAQICNYAHKLLLHAMALDDVAKLLPLCIQVKEVALWIGEPGQDHYFLQPLLPDTATTLSIDISKLFTNKRFKFKPSVLQHLTHLDAFGLDEDFWRVEWKNFRFLTRLSHLAIDAPKETCIVIISGILGDASAYKALQILLVTPAEIATIQELTSRYDDDPRFVCMSEVLDPIEHWISWARCGKDIWYVAERVKKGLEPGLVLN